MTSVSSSLSFSSSLSSSSLNVSSSPSLVICPRPLLNPPNCDITWAASLGSTWSTYLIINSLTITILTSVMIIQLYRLFTLRGYHPFTLQHIIYFLSFFSCLTFIVRSPDPQGWDNMITYGFYQMCSDLCSISLYFVLSIVVFSWVKILKQYHKQYHQRINNDDNDNNPPGVIPSQRSDRSLKFLEIGSMSLFAIFMLISSALQGTAHPTYYFPILKQSAQIAYFFILITIGWYYAYPIFKLLRQRDKERKQFHSQNQQNYAHGDPSSPPSSHSHPPSSSSQSSSSSQAHGILRLMIGFTIIGGVASMVQLWRLVLAFSTQFDNISAPQANPVGTFSSMVTQLYSDELEYFALIVIMILFRKIKADPRVVAAADQRSQNQSRRGMESRGLENGKGESVNSKRIKELEGKDFPSGVGWTSTATTIIGKFALSIKNVFSAKRKGDNNNRNAARSPQFSPSASPFPHSLNGIPPLSPYHSAAFPSPSSSLPPSIFSPSSSQYPTSPSSRHHPNVPSTSHSVRQPQESHMFTPQFFREAISDAVDDAHFGDNEGEQGQGQQKQEQEHQHHGAMGNGDGNVSVTFSGGDSAMNHNTEIEMGVKGSAREEKDDDHHDQQNR